jgi:CRP-like cAMP-binding protein
VELLSGLGPDDRSRLAAALRGRSYDRGALIFMRGDPGAGLYVVERGWVKLVLTSAEGKEFVLDVLGPGACFGELALLDGEPRSTDAVAQEDCRLLLLRRADFMALLDERPDVARTLLGVLSRRLRRDADLLAEAVFLDVPARLARALLQLAETRQSSGSELVLRVTQEELGGMLGTSRESVNKWLGYLERRGVLRRQRGGITLIRPDVLSRPN